MRISVKQLNQLYSWCVSNAKLITRYLESYECVDEQQGDLYVLTPKHIDMLLLEECDLEFVKSSIRAKYNMKVCPVCGKNSEKYEWDYYDHMCTECSTKSDRIEMFNELTHK